MFVMHRARAMTPGHPPAAHPAGKSDADQNRHRNADCPHAGQQPPAGGADAAAHGLPFESTHVPGAHLEAFYKTFDEIKSRALRRHDRYRRARGNAGLRDRWITGPSCAPFLNTAKRNVYTTVHICWGAQAALYYHYGIPQARTAAKSVRHFRPPGDTPCKTRWCAALTRCSTRPHSRHTEVCREDVEKPALRCACWPRATEAGLHILSHRFRPADLYCAAIWNTTATPCALEYERDVNKRPSHRRPRALFSA